MPARAFRIQADVDVAGNFTTATVYDEVTAADPITDEVVGTGRLLPPRVMTTLSNPDLFAAFAAIVADTANRTAERRIEFAASKAVEAQPVAEPIPDTPAPEITP